MAVAITVGSVIYFFSIASSAAAMYGRVHVYVLLLANVAVAVWFWSFSFGRQHATEKSAVEVLRTFVLYGWLSSVGFPYLLEGL